MTDQNDLLLRALRGETTATAPIWMMRQAGRTDPAYNALKEEVDLPLEKLFSHPELAARISLLPQRIGVDAIIYFQDILTPLGPMGAPFVFRPGPMTEHPVRSRDDAARLQLFDVEKELAFVGETFERIQEQLDGALPVLGFAGAPLTLLAFLVEGKSFGDDIGRTLSFLEENPGGAHELLRKLADMTTAFLLYQANCGAAAVQLFESAAYLVSRDVYSTFALPYQQKIFRALKGVVPTICFARDWPYLDDYSEAGADVISLPSTISITVARAALGEDTILQGNIDNHLLAEGPLDAIEAAARACVKAGGKRGHIVNLNHGLLRHTPFEHVQKVVEFVHSA